jgi:hypothetical protein
VVVATVEAKRIEAVVGLPLRELMARHPFLQFRDRCTPERQR